MLALVICVSTLVCSRDGWSPPHDGWQASRREGIWEAIGRGSFADVKRQRTGGKGYAGVVERAPDYLNPVLDALEAEGA